MRGHEHSMRLNSSFPSRCLISIKVRESPNSKRQRLANKVGTFFILLKRINFILLSVLTVFHVILNSIQCLVQRSNFIRLRQGRGGGGGGGGGWGEDSRIFRVAIIAGNLTSHPVKNMQKCRAPRIRESLNLLNEVQGNV